MTTVRMVAFVLAGMMPCACVDGIITGVRNEASTATISKTRVSPTMRMLFVVGLEGAGHHYLIGALRHMYEKSQDLVHLDECHMAKTYLVPQLMAESSTHYAETRELARKDMRRLALRENTLRWPGSVATLQGKQPKEMEACQQVGMLSYPNYAGPNKIWQYVDLGMLAEVAEAEGVDLRVVYLRRSLRDIIIANVKHRQFHNGLGSLHSTTRKERYMEYMRIMFTEIGVMHSMLAELGPGFVTCHDFRNMGNVQQASRIAKFVAPTQKIAELFKEALIETTLPRDNSTEHLAMKGASTVTGRLQRKMDILASAFC